MSTPTTLSQLHTAYLFGFILRKKNVQQIIFGACAAWNLGVECAVSSRAHSRTHESNRIRHYL